MDAAHGRTDAGAPPGDKRVSLLIHYPIFMLLAGGVALGVYLVVKKMGA